MSAIPKDAADIPTAFPHPTGAATVINSNSVDSNFTFTSNLSDSAFASTTFSSASASPSSYFSSSSSSSAAAASAFFSPSSVSNSRLESRDSALPPSPRDFSVAQHQAEYRGQAYLANESTVATIQAAGSYLQKIFTDGTDVNKDILRAASAASRARLQNPFAYNNSRSSSGSSRQSAKQAEQDKAAANLAEDRKTYADFPNPERSKLPVPPRASDLDHSVAPYRKDATPIDIEFLDDQNKQLYELYRRTPDYANKIAAEEAKRAAAGAKNTAPRGTAIPGGLPCDSTTPAAAPASTEAATRPKSASDLAIWPFGNLAISSSTPADPTDDSPAVLAKIGPGSTCPAAAIAAAAQADPLAPPAAPAAPAAPTEAEFLELEEKLTKISGRPFTIGRTARIHDPAVVAYFEDHALYIQNQISMARFREACINADSRSRWPHGP